MRTIDADYILSALGVFTSEEPESAHFMNGIKTAREIVENAPTVGGWISVKERMPEKRGRYLCWFGKNTLCVGADIATYLPEWHGFGILETDTVLQNVTHWMPLPEPPEGVSVDGIT